MPLRNDQVLSLLEFASKKVPHSLAWLALTLFCGLRPEEANKTTWADIDLDNGTIRVTADTSKVHKRRMVHPLPAGLGWLKLAKEADALLPCSKSTQRRWLKYFRKHLGFAAWPQDCARHTCLTHWLGLWNDAGKVANEAGNSARILIRHYREIVDRRESENFWSLTP